MKYLQMVLAVIPLVEALVKAFEGAGNGEEKKAKVLETLEKALRDPNFGFKEKFIEYGLKLADWLIDAIVWVKHLCGEFKHKDEDKA